MMRKYGVWLSGGIAEPSLDLPHSHLDLLKDFECFRSVDISKT